MDNWNKIKTVGKMQEFIEKHISEQISLHMLANEAGYSPWYTARIFKEITGKAPFEYIRLMRLTKAAERLRDENMRVIDVAFDFVFDSHEGFTRAFSREFGITPKKYCKTKPEIKLFIPEKIHGYYLRIQRGEDNMSNNYEGTNTNTVFVQVIERPERKLILKRGQKATHYFEYCEEVGCDIWQILTDIKEAIYEPVGMWLPENMVKPGTSKYVQGVEVPHNYNGAIPEGFEIVDLQPCKMMIFQGQPYDDDKFEGAIEQLWDVMKSYNPEIYGFQWADETAPRFQLAPMGYRGYIEARPVKQMNS